MLKRTGQMKNKNAKYLIAAAIIVIGLGFWSAFSSEKGQADTATHDAPAHVEAIEGSEFSRVTLTARAAERLDIQIGEASDKEIAGATRRVVPYSALVYDAEGNTFVYTNPEPLVFVRAAVTVDRIDGEFVILTEGPKAGTKVASVGGALLLGTESGVGH
jgi:hypothetical protein